MNQPPTNPPDNTPGSIVNWSIQWDQWAKLNSPEWHSAFHEANTRQIHTDLISDFLAVRMLQAAIRLKEAIIEQARYAQPMFYAVDPITVQPKPLNPSWDNSEPQPISWIDHPPTKEI